jgi:hypothetical protein
MSRIDRLVAQHVEVIPEDILPGTLYVSERYRTATHLCCCGCGREVVTPLNPAKWRIREVDGQVSLSPSIGNWEFPCRSHYWIAAGRVDWAGAFSQDRIRAVQLRDRQDEEAWVHGSRGAPQGLLGRLVHWLREAWRRWTN